MGHPAALAFCYFAQRQNLEELRLFKDLFTEFNGRYDKMNEKLENIRSGKLAEDPSFRKTLVDYFNLCAEGYLFYQEGFLENARIRQTWDDEVSHDSYYGLTLDVIRKGASLRA